MQDIYCIDYTFWCDPFSFGQYKGESLTRAYSVFELNPTFTAELTFIY